MILFKHHNINSHLFDLLTNAKLFCCERTKLNDPHDGLFLISPELRDKLSKNVLPGVRKHLSNAPIYDQIPDDLIEDFAKESFGNQEFYNLIHNSEAKLSLTVCSFTETSDNELMWAHYSNNFRGVCLEFDFTQEPSIIDNLVKVKYDNNVPKINSFEFTDIKNAASIKRLAWSYEREWRILHVDNFVSFSPICLKRIHFGARTSKEDCDSIIAACLDNKLSHVDFKKIKIDLEGIVFE